MEAVHIQTSTASHMLHQTSPNIQIWNTTRYNQKVYHVAEDAFIIY